MVSAIRRPQSMTPVEGVPSLWVAHIDTFALTPGYHDVTVTAVAGAQTASHTIPVDWADWAVIFAVDSGCQLPDVRGWGCIC
jgi:hypothetical protein